MTSDLLEPERTPTAAPGSVRALGPDVELQRSLDRLSELNLDGLTGDAHAALLAGLARARARLAALELRVIASADRARVAARSGAASTGAWAARIANSDQVVAQ